MNIATTIKNIFYDNDKVVETDGNKKTVIHAKIADQGSSVDAAELVL